mmetsp:Transcript_11249/g.28203  ORF Transcript_11249/g.28203 Transcript_11249/m.28203 type:complete len:218 (-) Transcript_11249:270-923(-)
MRPGSASLGISSHHSIAICSGLSAALPPRQRQRDSSPAPEVGAGLIWGQVANRAVPTVRMLHLNPALSSGTCAAIASTATFGALLPLGGGGRLRGEAGRRRPAGARALGRALGAGSAEDLGGVLELHRTRRRQHASEAGLHHPGQHGQNLPGASKERVWSSRLTKCSLLGAELLRQGTWVADQWLGAARHRTQPHTRSIRRCRSSREGTEPHDGDLG